MNLLASFKEREEALIKSLVSKQLGIDDPNGKGASTENVIDRELLAPYMSARFGCYKGTVLDSTGNTSAAMDRVVYSREVGSPLVFDEVHCLFPNECVVAAIEITMRLDATKLRTDIDRLAQLRAMRSRRYIVSVPGSATKVMAAEEERAMGCRTVAIGLPSDANWRPHTIATAFKEMQQAANTLIHGLYVIGIGFFETIPESQGTDGLLQLRAYTGDDRLFRFTTFFRRALDRWPTLPKGFAADVSHYVKDSGIII